MKGILPQYFTTKKNIPEIAAVNLMHAMQYEVLEHYRSRFEFLNSMQDISTAENRAEYSMYAGTLMYVDKLVWNKLTDRQKTSIQSRYMVIDPDTNEINVPGIVSADSIRSTIVAEGFTLNENFDFEVSDHKIKFFTAVDTELWDQINIQVSVLGKPFPVSVTALPVYLYKAVFDEDWYYKRAGILVGLSEFTEREKVVSLARMVFEGYSEDNISAVIAAYSGYDISVRKDKVKSVSPGTVVTETEVYTIPEFPHKSSVRVFPGKELYHGEHLFHIVYAVNDNKFEDWVSNSDVVDILKNADSDFENKLRTVISNNPRLLWGSKYPVRVTPDGDPGESIGLWAGAPVAVVPALIFKIGEDAEIEETHSDNISMYNTLDVPEDITGIQITYGAGGVTIAADGGFSETTGIDDSGVFTSEDLGVSGRIMDTGVSGVWEGSVTQTRGNVTVEPESTTELLRVSFSSGWNEGLEPQTGDWVSFVSSGVWKKGRIYELIRDDDLNVTGALIKWYGNDVPDTGEVAALVYRSFDGEPYTGTDNVRIDAFGELLKIVSRHIEVLVIDGAVAPDAEAILLQHRKNISMWKAYIPVLTTTTDDFIDVRNKLKLLEE